MPLALLNEWVFLSTNNNRKLYGGIITYIKKEPTISTDNFSQMTHAFNRPKCRAHVKKVLLSRRARGECNGRARHQLYYVARLASQQINTQDNGAVFIFLIAPLCRRPWDDPEISPCLHLADVGVSTKIQSDSGHIDASSKHYYMCT